VKRKNLVTEQPVTTCEGGIPGTQSIFVKTWGCTHNNSDSEYMAGLLGAFGYNIILDESLKQKAELWLLNSCTVKVRLN
jgi:threonylcarbamoyladenosine tRNA methylthiotransferase CDKAL1